MHTNIENIDVVVKLLKQHNIRQIVISPGGTNIPFINAVQDDEFFTCYSIVDERSAMYFAIGLYLQSGEPIVTSCTSAQATRNYIPGLTEAYYKHAPILAITMSKHQRFTYQQYMQAPDQISLPNDAVKSSYMLPYLVDENDYLHSMRTVNEAILELTRHTTGPVQLDIPWLDFPLDDEVSELHIIKRYNANHLKSINIKDKKILLVIGEHRPFEDNLKACIEKFCQCSDVAVYVNHLSNYKGKYIVEGNLQLLTMGKDTFNDNLKPDIMITIGGQTGDYPFYTMLSQPSIKGIEHWLVSCDGKVVDTYDKLTVIYECSEYEFFSMLGSSKNVTHSYFEDWKNQISKNKLDIELPFSSAYVAQQIHNKIPANSFMQFSILNSLRIWNMFDIDPSITCYSNVGAFGIDGGMSTFFGLSMGTEELCFIVIGDLAFFYDMNSLGIRHIKNNVRILLINNNGGVEFKLYNCDNNAQNRYIAAGNHFKNAKGWAETCDFSYMAAKNKSEFSESYNAFLKSSDKPMVFEIFVSDKDDAEAYRMIVSENAPQSFERSIKSKIKGIIGRK